MNTNKHLYIAPELQSAIRQELPIVALESTIISHGMPYPQNVETALAVEAIVRKHDAFPATIAVIAGIMYVGLTAAQIDLIGHPDQSVLKVSRRDLPFVIAQKQHGATTVSATMIIAKMAGIKIFATGGIGGVHRGAQQSMDISADLQELAHTNVNVVCAGAKSILDLRRTLEYLETHGVPVIGYGTQEFPAFYHRKSGLTLTHSADTPRAIAEILQAKDDLCYQGGSIIANPIPKAYEMEYATIQQAIEIALQAANEQGVSGKAITPFLLNFIKEHTKGKSLDANIKLVYNNAQLAADIAVAWSNL